MSTFQPQNKTELQTAVDAWVSNQSSATATYGAINTWNTSAVTDMSNLFSKSRNSNMSGFNSDISNWNTSNVTDMSTMFFGANSFNNGDNGNNQAKSLNNWDVSKVTSMASMFRDAYAFNQPLEQWNVGNVTNMQSMFTSAIAFNQDISIWDTSNVTSISYMFAGAISMDQPLQYWNTSSVTGNPFYSGYDGTFQDATAMIARGFYATPNSGQFNQPLPAGSNTGSSGVQAELQAIDNDDTTATLSNPSDNKKRLAIALAKLT